MAYFEETEDFGRILDRDRISMARFDVVGTGTGTAGSAAALVLLVLATSSASSSSHARETSLQVGSRTSSVQEIPVAVRSSCSTNPHTATKSSICSRIPLVSPERIPSSRPDLHLTGLQISSKSPFPAPLICTGDRRNPTSCGTTQATREITSCLSDPGPVNPYEPPALQP